MELTNVKQIFMPEGEARRILDEQSVIIWEKAISAISDLSIVQSNETPIDSFCYLRYASVQFTATAKDISGKELSERDLSRAAAEWSISGLPNGLDATIGETLAAGVTVSGYAEQTGSFEVTVSVSAFGVSSTKMYRLLVVDDGNGITISSGDLGTWYNRQGGMKDGTNQLALTTRGTVDGTAAFYITDLATGMKCSSRQS